jgi:hypothetical protein
MKKKLTNTRNELLTAIREGYDEDGLVRGSYGKKEYWKRVNPLSLIPKIPFTVPYNISISIDLSFSMDYTYKENSEDKISTIAFKIKLNKYKREPLNDYIQRKQEIFSKIQNLFSQYLETS